MHFSPYRTYYVYTLIIDLSLFGGNLSSPPSCSRRTFLSSLKVVQPIFPLHKRRINIDVNIHKMCVQLRHRWNQYAALRYNSVPAHEKRSQYQVPIPRSAYRPPRTHHDWLLSPIQRGTLHNSPKDEQRTQA